MKKLDTSRIKTYSLKDRPSKVRMHDFAKPHQPGASFKDFFSSLPNILGAQDLKNVVAALVQARRDQRPVMLGMGAHSIKVGLNPVLIDLMERGIITSLSLNGAGIIHDFELAFVGQTSEDVDKEILSGAFGMAEETGRMLNQAIASASDEEGIGACVGRMIQTGTFRTRRTACLPPATAWASRSPSMSPSARTSSTCTRPLTDALWELPRIVTFSPSARSCLNSKAARTSTSAQRCFCPRSSLKP